MPYSELKKRIQKLKSRGYERISPLGYQKVLGYNGFKTLITIQNNDITDTIPEVFRVLIDYREDEALDKMLIAEETKMTEQILMAGEGDE